MAKRIAIVAVETNLLGRTAMPTEADAFGHGWPFAKDKEAEIVAAFVSDLDEAGAIKFLLRGKSSGALGECYPQRIRIAEEPYV